MPEVASCNAASDTHAAAAAVEVPRVEVPTVPLPDTGPVDGHAPRCSSLSRMPTASARVTLPAVAAKRSRATVEEDPFLESLMNTSLYSMGAYFSDQHPDLVDEVIAQAEAIEAAGLRSYAAENDMTVEACFETLLTGLAVRYYNAVASLTPPAHKFVPMRLPFGVTWVSPSRGLRCDQCRDFSS